MLLTWIPAGVGICLFLRNLSHYETRRGVNLETEIRRVYQFRHARVQSWRLANGGDICFATPCLVNAESSAWPSAWFGCSKCWFLGGFWRRLAVSHESTCFIIYCLRAWPSAWPSGAGKTATEYHFPFRR